MNKLFHVAGILGLSSLVFHLYLLISVGWRTDTISFLLVGLVLSFIQMGIYGRCKI